MALITGRGGVSAVGDRWRVKGGRWWRVSGGGQGGGLRKVERRCRAVDGNYQKGGR